MLRLPWGGKNVAGPPRGWNEIVRDSCGNVALFDFCGAHAAAKIVSKLLKDVIVCSYFTDTIRPNRIIISTNNIA